MIVVVMLGADHLTLEQSDGQRSLRASSPDWASEVSLAKTRASERQSREGPRKGELATISHKISFVLRPDEGKYHWLKNDVPEIKVD